MKKRIISSLVAIGFGSIAGAAMALNVAGSVGAGLEHSDNIEQVSNDESSDTIRTADVNLEVDHAGDRIQASANYNIARDDYADDTYSAETQTNGSAQLNIELVDDTLNWLTTNATTYSQVDSTGKDTPDNSSNQNIFTTGPEWILKLGQVDSLTTAIMYQDVTFDNDVESDNARTAGTIDWTHYLADQRRVLAGVMRSNIKYDESEFSNGNRSDYDMDRYYVGYGSSAGYLTYDFKIGKDKTMPDVGDDTDGDFREINVGYARSEHSINLGYSKELTDTTVSNYSDDVFNNIALNPNGVANPATNASVEQSALDFDTSDSNYQLAEIVENTNTALSYTSPTYSGFSGSATLYENIQDYQVSSGDEKITGYVLAVNYQVTEAWSFNLSYGEETTNFATDLDLGEDEQTTTMLSTKYLINPQWSIWAWVQHISQDNSTVAENNYDENVVAAGLRYSFE
jgi:hypothetical protein